MMRQMIESLLLFQFVLSSYSPIHMYIPKSLNLSSQKRLAKWILFTATFIALWGFQVYMYTHKCKCNFSPL